jgi:cytochrome c
MDRNPTELGSIHNKSFLVVKSINLKGIKKVTYRYSSVDIGATIEVHLNSSRGPIISTLKYPSTGSWDIYNEASSAITDPGGKNNLYFVFRKDDAPNKHMCSLDWIRFDN